MKTIQEEYVLFRRWWRALGMVSGEGRVRLGVVKVVTAVGSWGPPGVSAAVQVYI